MDVKRLSSDDEDDGVRRKRNLPAFGGVRLVTETKTSTKKSKVSHSRIIYLYSDFVLTIIFLQMLKALIKHKNPMQKDRMHWPKNGKHCKIKSVP